MNAKFKTLNFLDLKENPCEFFSSICAFRMCIKTCPHIWSSLNAKVYAFCDTLQCSRIQNYWTIYLVKQHSTNVWGELP